MPEPDAEQNEADQAAQALGRIALATPQPAVIRPFQALAPGTEHAQADPAGVQARAERQMSRRKTQQPQAAAHRKQSAQSDQTSQVEVLRMQKMQQSIEQGLAADRHLSRITLRQELQADTPEDGFFDRGQQPAQP